MNLLSIISDWEFMGSRQTKFFSPVRAISMWFTLRRIFCCILMTIDSDWRECVNSFHGLSMTKLADLSRRCANVLLGSHVIAGFSLSVVFYMVRLVKYADSEELSREFPVKMQFSFEVKESPIYELIVVGQILYEMSLATIVGMLNALLATLVSSYSRILYLRFFCILSSENF